MANQSSIRVDHHPATNCSVLIYDSFGRQIVLVSEVSISNILHSDALCNLQPLWPRLKSLLNDYLLQCNHLTLNNVNLICISNFEKKLAQNKLLDYWIKLKNILSLKITSIYIHM